MRKKKRNSMRFDTDQIKQNIEEGYYRRIGSGTARRVFDLDNGYVAKVAKNPKGIAQNKAEFKIASGGRSRIFARVPLITRDYSLLIMERADKINSMSDVRRYFNVRDNNQLFQLKEFANIPELDLCIADLCRPVNWGRIGDRPVIVDYGFTYSVKNKYYHKQAFRF